MADPDGNSGMRASSSSPLSPRTPVGASSRAQPTGGGAVWPFDQLADHNVEQEQRPSCTDLLSHPLVLLEDLTDDDRTELRSHLEQREVFDVAADRTRPRSTTWRAHPHGHPARRHVQPLLLED
jgi:hypothetical protein